METFIKLSEFFGGLIFFLSLGWLIGHLLNLEKWSAYSKTDQNSGTNKDTYLKH